MRRLTIGYLALAAALLAACSHGSMTLAEVRPAPRLIRSAYYDASSTASIAVGSSLDQVRQVLGVLPDENDSTCFYIDSTGARLDGLAKTLRYPGFTVSLEQLPGSSEYMTTHIDVRAPNLWVTPGLAVGMSAKSLRKLVGKPELSAVDGGSGDRILHYSFNSTRGDLRIHLAHGIITIIELGSREWPHAG